MENKILPFTLENGRIMVEAYFILDDFEQNEKCSSLKERKVGTLDVFSSMMVKPIYHQPMIAYAYYLCSLWKLKKQKVTIKDVGVDKPFFEIITSLAMFFYGADRVDESHSKIFPKLSKRITSKARGKIFGNVDKLAFLILVDSMGARHTIERQKEEIRRLEERIENNERTLEEICKVKHGKEISGAAFGIVAQALSEASSLLYSEFESVCDDELREQYETTTALVDKALEIVRKCKS